MGAIIAGAIIAGAIVAGAIVVGVNIVGAFVAEQLSRSNCRLHRSNCRRSNYRRSICRTFGWVAHLCASDHPPPPSKPPGGGAVQFHFYMLADLCKDHLCILHFRGIFRVLTSSLQPVVYFIIMHRPINYTYTDFKRQA